MKNTNSVKLEMSIGSVFTVFGVVALLGPLQNSFRGAPMWILGILLLLAAGYMFIDAARNHRRSKEPSKE